MQGNCRGVHHNSYAVQYLFTFMHVLIINLHDFKQRLQNFKVDFLYFEQHGMDSVFIYLMLIHVSSNWVCLALKFFKKISPLDEIFLKLNPTCTCFCHIQLLYSG